MFDRIAPVYDLMNRVMTAGLDQRWRRLTARARRPAGRPRARRLLRHRRPRARGARGRRARSSGSTSRRGCSSARGARRREIEWVQGDLLELPFEDGVVRRRDRRLRRPQRRRPRARARRAAPRPAAGRPARDPRDHAAARALRLFYRLWFDVLIPLPARSCPAARPTRTCPRASAAFRPRTRWPALMREHGFAEVSYRLLAGGIVACTRGPAA